MKKMVNKICKTGSDEYIKTFVPGLDKLLGEGIPKGSSVLVEGGPGSGKTIFYFTLKSRRPKKIG